MVRLKYGSNATDTVSGVIIYPDDFSFSEAGVASMPFGARRPVTQINAADWAALEEAGCVFLPGSRYRSFTGTALDISETNYGSNTNYWSATASSAANAYNAFFYYNNGSIVPAGNDGRQYAFAVRLVQDL